MGAAGDAVAGHSARRSCHEPCHAGSKCHHLVRMPAVPGRAPGGIRTHTKRILRTLDRVYCGLYLRLRHHRIPHQPHQPTTVDFISCHEPCHAASDKCGSLLQDGFAPAGERQSSVERVPRSACVDEARSRCPPAAHFDWPMYAAHSSRSPQARVQIRPVEDGRR
jgi:hypothetical protein